MSPGLGRLRRLGASGLVREAAHRVLTRLPVDHLPGGWAPPVYALSWWLTERCDLSCEMCWVEASPRQPMTPEEWLRLADEVRPWRPRITLTGGEPAMYRGLLDVVAGVKQRGLYLSLNTNGLRLPALAGELVRLGLDDVSVSLDGLAASHDRVRGRADAFARTLEGIAALRRERGSRPWPVLRVTTVLSADNVAELEPLHRELARLGVDCHTLQHRWFVTPRTLAAHADAAGRRLGLGAEALRGYLWAEPAPLPGLQDVVKRLEQARAGPRLLLSPLLSAAEADEYYSSPEQALRATCRSRWYRITILPDGVATPCLGLVAGSVRERPFASIWNGPEMRGFRVQIASQGLLPGCLRCCGLFSDAPAPARAD